MRKMLGLGVELPCTAYHLYKIREIRCRKLMLLDFQIVIKLLKRLGVK
jgi:hypothetical protein